MSIFLSNKDMAELSIPKRKFPVLAKIVDWMKDVSLDW